MKAKKFELWTLISVLLLGTFILFLVYPMFGLLKQSVVTPEGEFTLQEFAKFFSKSYYTGTIVNSVKVTLSVTAIALILGIPIAYFYSFYRIRGAKVLFVLSILCSMSAPFIGAYSWIMLLGRSGGVAAVGEAVATDNLIYGVVTKVESTSYDDGKGGTYNARTVTVAGTDGGSYRYQTDNPRDKIFPINTY